MADYENPVTTSKANLNGTALQRHLRFFSRSTTQSDLIYPWEIYASFRALGFNTLISLVSVLDFTVHVGYPTSEDFVPIGWVVNGCPVNAKNIARAKHGSDTGSYDRNGEFDEASFERIWKFDMDKKGGLFFSEIIKMCVANRNVFDVAGFLFQVFLWGSLWLLAADEKGVLRMEDVRRQYDGSLFYEIEERRRKGERLPLWRGGALW
ncbi:Caleosin [Ilyonectria robusta]|uniref:Caleosin n=1 Tax=Ilyonectria robusta TaxID=1079257 RepID=UPI001E8DCF93|nr:Caleosin [Ilyonectria robusta]KAH8647499.1 Caleosin [Ilyonectria robusta]